MGWIKFASAVVGVIITGLLFRLINFPEEITSVKFWEKFFDYNLNYFVPLVIVYIIFFIVEVAKYKKRNSPRIKRGNRAIPCLKDIANGKRDNESALWGYGRSDSNVVQLNNTWEEWIRSLLKTTGRTDLDYYNFGDEFYFIDLSSSKKIEISTGKRAHHEKVGNTFRKGMVLRLLPND